MTAQQYDRPTPRIERPFTTVRAALPAASIAVFDAELQAITEAPVVDLGALDDLLSDWWRIATRAAVDPADRQRMHQEAGQLQSSAPGRPDPGRGAGPTRDPLVGVHRPHGRRRRRSPDQRPVRAQGGNA
jgi:hypothetical protein